MIPRLTKRLEEVVAQATESDAIALAHQLVDELSKLQDGFEAVDIILRFMEERPDFDFGSPGPLVHYLETFYRRGYEERLCDSVRRRPTAHTVWMLNRVINGAEGGPKLHFVSLLDEVLSRTDLDDRTLSRTRQFRALHK